MEDLGIGICHNGLQALSVCLTLYVIEQNRVRVNSPVQGLDLFEYLPPTYHRVRWHFEWTHHIIEIFIISQGDGYAPESKKRDNQILQLEGSGEDINWSPSITEVSNFYCYDNLIASNSSTCSFTFVTSTNN
ncbi:7247_t:CDS:2 [Diversispora eburnea]|uniref:7247_t:CDS:1 n=1 Tax=Diversispora eburnea TaxID=1213867 RepID=A0A9N8V0B6_9GLOM|nr:7247_t:CDS:2 [Diversispora eburnea]